MLDLRDGKDEVDDMTILEIEELGLLENL